MAMQPGVLITLITGATLAMKEVGADPSLEDALHAIMMSSPCLAGTVAPCARAVGRPLLEGIVTVAKRMVDGFESFTATLPHAIREQTRLEL